MTKIIKPIAQKSGPRAVRKDHWRTEIQGPARVTFEPEKKVYILIIPTIHFIGAEHAGHTDV